MIKITCSDFFLSKKEVTVNYEDIESLAGGIFENRISGIMKVCDEKNEYCIGFYNKITNSNKLATIILSKVKKSYDEVLEKLISKNRKKRK